MQALGLWLPTCRVYHGLAGVVSHGSAWSIEEIVELFQDMILKYFIITYVRVFHIFYSITFISIYFILINTLRIGIGRPGEKVKT